MEVTARTDRGEMIALGKREYWEIGVDLEGSQRLGAWEIKEIIDQSLPPRKTTEERFVKDMPAGTRSAEVEVKLTLYPSPRSEVPVYRVTRKVFFGE